MRILHIVASEKWTGAAAVVSDWTQALVDAGVEAQFGFVAGSPLARRLLPIGWARPLLSRAHGPVGALTDSRRLAETLERERFDIVHAHRSHDHYVAAFALRGKPARLVRTFHHIGQARTDPVTRALFRRTAAFSYACRAIAKEHGAEGSVHSPIVDLARFSPGDRPGKLLERLGVQDSAFVAGTVGKIAKGRGHQEAIAAAAPLADVTLLHVGKGEHQPELVRRAGHLGAGQRNVWAGYEEDALPELYRGMDVFLFTASGSQQGQRAILEAMASGLPIVALPVPGVADLVTDGVEGIVANDVAGLTAALRRLRKDDPWRRRMGASARQKALAFTAEKFAAQALAFYEAVLRASEAAPPGGSWPRPSDGSEGSSHRVRPRT